MKAFTNIILNIDDRGVAEIRLNRPQVHNCFDGKMVSELIACFTVLERTDEVKVVLISGEGKSFSSGADLNWLKTTRDKSYDDNWKEISKIADMYELINNFPKPLIAKIHGAAIGGGSGLAAACDYVIAESGSIFGFPEVRLGISPAVITQNVINKIGESYARAYFISGMHFNAEQALQMRLIHQIAPTREVLEGATKTVVDEFLKSAPMVMQVTKKMITEVIRLSYETDHEGRKNLHNYLVSMATENKESPEAEEGITATLEGRKAEWRG